MIKAVRPYPIILNGLFFPIRSLQIPDNTFIKDAVLSAIPSIKLKRMKPGGSILLLKLTKLTNLTKPKLMKKNVMQM